MELYRIEELMSGGVVSFVRPEAYIRAAQGKARRDYIAE
jgi:hypothetical protein